MRRNKNGATGARLTSQQSHHTRGRRIVQAERRLIDEQDGWILRRSEGERESATLTIGAARRWTAHQICDAKFSGDRFGARHILRHKHLRERTRAEEQAWVLWDVADHLIRYVSFTAIKRENSCSEREEC